MQSLAVLVQVVLEMTGSSILIRFDGASFLKISFSWLFEQYGPNHIWEFAAVLLVFCIFLWINLYGRMVSNSERFQLPDFAEKNEQALKYPTIAPAS